MTLWTVSPPGCSAHGILQARILEWLPYPPPEDLLDPGMEPASLTSPALAGGFFTTSVTHLLTAYCILGMGNRKEAETALDPALLLFVSESGGIIHSSVY